MKKILFFAALSVFTFTTVQSQSIRFGAKAGVNFASITGGDLNDVEGITSFHAGAVAKIGVTELFSVQPELIYSSQGYGLGRDTTVNLHYLNLPIMADFALAEGFSLQGGPQIGFNISSKVDFDGNKEDVEGFQTLDLGVGIGAQYILPMNLFFQARYVIGFTKVFKDVEGNSFDDKNSVISLSVGYFFN